MPWPRLPLMAPTLGLLASAHVLTGGKTTEPSTTVTSSTGTSTTTTRSTTTSTTFTTSSTTVTITSTTSTTTTTPPHVQGGEATQLAFKGWLEQWRKLYRYGSPCGVVACLVPQIHDDAELPLALRGIRPKVVISEGGVAGGVVTEGMGYGIMIEGFEAAKGSKTALNNGLALVKSWIGMTQGPDGWAKPFAGGKPGVMASAVEVGEWPYGVSAIEASPPGRGYVGLPAWKFPLDQCEGGCNGTAMDGDQDAVLGMTYLAAALHYPADFVDVVARSIIAFASADLGFPDLYRTLPGGERIFVPKMGSNWGGLTPERGAFKTTQEAWCYGPGYFSPGHYRAFRDFARGHWNPTFNMYLPPHLDGSPSSLQELLTAFDSAVIAGYNILYRSSCNSGAVANWVGVKAECKDPDALHCEGVPWKHTPYVGDEKGTCNTSNTAFGQYGADASRAPWRIAMDYILYRKESINVTMYDRDGKEDQQLVFGSQSYLNRIAGQYKWHAKCDGGIDGDCLKAEFKPPYSPWKIAAAFDTKAGAPDLTCDNVPNKADTWWAGYMSYPTFSAFVAPFEPITPEESIGWMDTFVSICNFAGSKPTGSICQVGYFDLSQSVVSTMVMSKVLRKIDDELPLSTPTNGPISMYSVPLTEPADVPPGSTSVVGFALAALLALVAFSGLVRALRPGNAGASYRSWCEPPRCHQLLGRHRLPMCEFHEPVE